MLKIAYKKLKYIYHQYFNIKNLLLFVIFKLTHSNLLIYLDNADVINHVLYFVLKRLEKRIYNQKSSQYDTYHTI